MDEKVFTCAHCGGQFFIEEKNSFDGQELCPSCMEHEVTICECCGNDIWVRQDVGDSSITLCGACYDRHYTSCEQCGRIIHNDDACYLSDDDDNPLCHSCYRDAEEKAPHYIADYSYKPNPLFCGEGNRYFGVELEIDGGGECDSNAQQILDIANTKSVQAYCKHDGSLDDGFEIVTHPMTLAFHQSSMPWAAILEKAVSMGYRSHKIGTCGLHVHVNRNTFGPTYQAQEACIARVLYFFEKHWEELLKFSRRTEEQLKRWAARYGYKDRPQDILEHAKSCYAGRYTCVNLTNTDTVEFRMFRGTLKLNTLIATLQLVDKICEVAISLSDEEGTLLDLVCQRYYAGAVPGTDTIPPGAPHLCKRPHRDGGGCLMCCLFGIIDYRDNFSGRQKARLLQILANQCESRGTDATGIAYMEHRHLRIYKRPLPAHKLRFILPDSVKAVMGHTRMTTQGSEKKNYNNHPFLGRVGGTRFALAHNGVLYNDHSLRRSLHLPPTEIETDSFVAVQLIEWKKALSFDSLKYMAEQVEGSFMFTLLGEDGSLYFVKGDNPICLIHFPKSGFYLYASTEEILGKALKKMRLFCERPVRVELNRGDILKIDPLGKQSRSKFDPAVLYDWGLPYSYGRTARATLNEEYSSYLNELKSVAGAFGYSPEAIERLYQRGMPPEEIEEFLYCGEL